MLAYRKAITSGLQQPRRSGNIAKQPLCKHFGKREAIMLITKIHATPGTCVGSCRWLELKRDPKGFMPFGATRYPCSHKNKCSYVPQVMFAVCMSSDTCRLVLPTAGVPEWFTGSFQLKAALVWSQYTYEPKFTLKRCMEAHIV
jgi:hypothetical protein